MRSTISSCFAGCLFGREFTVLRACLVLLIGVPQNGLARIEQIPSAAASPKANALNSTDNSAKSSNPYSVIVDRNVFRLSDPPPPPPPPRSEASQVTIRLTGIIKMTGAPIRAMFASTPKDTKGATAYFNLAEGERDGDLELVRIIEDKGLAMVISAGSPLTVSFQDRNSDPPGGSERGNLVSGHLLPPIQP